jgi:hypothetical protein
VSRPMFAETLSLIARLRVPPRARITGRRDQMRHTTTPEVRLEQGETREFQSGKPRGPSFGLLTGWA